MPSSPVQFAAESNSTPETSQLPISFADLGLNHCLLRAVRAEGYETPSPIQEKAIPAVLSGRDVMAAAQTGTGKTAGFTLPLLQQISRGPAIQSNSIRALVLTPTRELAAQVGASVETYGKFTQMRSQVVFGGVKINPQMMKLRKGADILVATPGRLLDLYNQNAVKFARVEVLILDEADRMLDMGFIRDIKKIISLLPRNRQTLMFSATYNKDIQSLAQKYLREPIEISVSPKNTTAKTVEQLVLPVDQPKKAQLLTQLIKTNNWHQVLVFTRTKHRANALTKKLNGAGIEAAAIHGNKSQGARTKALANFKQGKVQALIATDIAARGLDIEQLEQVVNFELPNVPEDYVHRIGRTGRAGASGKAVSLVSADEGSSLSSIERLIKTKIPRETIEGFEPSEALTATGKPLKKKAKAYEKPPAKKRTRSRKPVQESSETCDSHRKDARNKKSKKISERKAATKKSSTGKAKCSKAKINPWETVTSR